MKLSATTTITGFLFNVSLLCAGQDKIVLRSGDTLHVEITKSTPDFVEFKHPNETAVNQESRNLIKVIIHKSGRIEEISAKTLLADIKGENDWEKVVITYVEADVKGLTKVGPITGVSGWGGPLGSGMGSSGAIKKLKKKAAKQKASIVLITDKPDQHTPYGSGTKISGMAYR